jgi:hypothetical protein
MTLSFLKFYFILSYFRSHNSFFLSLYDTKHLQNDTVIEHLIKL